MPLPEPNYLKVCRALLNARFWVILIVILGAGYLYGTFDIKPSNAPSNATIAPKQAFESDKYRLLDGAPTSEFKQPSIPMQQGIDKIYTGKDLIAPLEIKTSAGPEKYYIKLVDAQTGETVMTFFIYGGQRFETKVPLGIYYLKYASGEAWYGEGRWFGPNTSYSKADQTFEFYRLGSQISGYTVELILQRSGNLSTRKISASDF